MRERGEGWSAHEVPLAIDDYLTPQSLGTDVVLIDCLTLWLSNLFGADLWRVLTPARASFLPAYYCSIASSACLVLAAIGATFLVIRALWAWSEYSVSSRRLTRSYFLLFVAPFVVLLLLPTTSFIDIPGAQRQLCASTLETQTAGPFGSAMLSVAGLGGAGVCEQRNLVRVGIEGRAEEHADVRRVERSEQVLHRRRTTHVEVANATGEDDRSAARRHAAILSRSGVPQHAENWA